MDKDLVLIIDDNVDTIRLLSVIIGDMARVLFATDGLAGIAAAKKHRPNLILLDVEMVAMDGFEVCRLISADPDLSGIAVVFVTGRSSSADEIRCLEAGAVDFITKPLVPAVVQARVKTQLRLQNALEVLKHQATRDGLTGLFNRRYFDESFEEEFARHRRYGTPLAVALIDIDFFKCFNDVYGHQIGDRCLIEVAQALKGVVKRPAEFIARYGGEEFVIVLPGSQADKLPALGGLLCNAVASLKIAHESSTACKNVSISIGMSTALSIPEDSPIRLLKRADDALYAAKDSGRNGYCVRVEDAG